jgi:transposase
MKDTMTIQHLYEGLKGELNEGQRRAFGAVAADILGRGGISAAARATGMSRGTIRRGRNELSRVPDGLEEESGGRIRRAGGGRKRASAKDQTLKTDLERLIEPVTRGDPESPLRWTCKSVRRLAGELKRQGHGVSHRLVAQLLHELGYSLQANRKTLEGASHPDRDAQFGHIQASVEKFQAAGEPVISVDTKKKELIGPFKNGGRELRPKGEPEQVRVHDFVIPELGRAAPYGVYDLGRNEGWVSVGIDHDTATFAVESIRRWWERMGRPQYPSARKLLITADGGGSNGSRVRLWKVELQRLADETGLEIAVCHFPPGTSKWNLIEHQLFSRITQNWRGKPLTSHEVLVNLIRATTTRSGLHVDCELDTTPYPSGVKVSKKELESVRLQRDSFHGEWNYTILPSTAINGQVIS